MPSLERDIPRVVLYVAMSIDGFIASPDGKSDWVSDTGLFEDEIRRAGCCVVGRKTFEQYLDDGFPVEGAVNLVLASDGHGYSHREDTEVVASPAESVMRARELGYSELVVCGGARTWSSFLKEGFANQYLLDVEPVVLGEGMRLADHPLADWQLELVDSEVVGDGVIHNRYETIPAPVGPSGL